MLQQNGDGNIDWIGLAAKMFLGKLTNQSVTREQRGGMHSLPLPSPPRARPLPFKPRTTALPTSLPTALPSQLPPDCVATIRQFEALRVQLLRQLVHYQTQLLALKMPSLHPQPSEPVEKTKPQKGKTVQKGSRGVKTQTAFKKINCRQDNETKKWEKVQFPAHALKTPSKRRSQLLRKSKKSSKKASKRKLHNVETAMSNTYQVSSDDNNLNRKTKRPCQSYQSYLGNYSSSTDSVYSSKQLKFKKDFGLETLIGKEVAHDDPSFMNEGKKNSLIPKLPKSRVLKINKKMSSAFAFDTATESAQSSL